ncbi:MAG: permease-like cell division protein FtsX [Clostridia bacterium]|nr:permease-like cell division protein FtsX [Clostridia bacterium]
MRYNVLTYLIGEGFSNVFKNKKQAMTSIGMMCVTMLIFGVFFVIGENLNHFVDQVQAEQGIQVFMKLDSTDEQITTLKQELHAIEGINTVDVISQAQALQQVKERFGDKAYLLEGHDESIFQVSFIVTLTDLSKSSKIQDQISHLSNVEEIRSSNETISTLVKIAKGIRIATYVISICLIIFAIFIIANTIKLTVHARRREISIMKYVGATNSFIRWPFAVEGMIIGIISGAISTALLAGLYTLAVNNDGFVKIISKMGLTLLHFTDILNLVVLVYLVLGIGIGVLGSTISMRKYLKV